MPNVLSDEEGDGLIYISKLGLYVSRRWAHMSGSWAGELGLYVSRRWARVFQGDGLINYISRRWANMFQGDGLICFKEMGWYVSRRWLTVLSLQLFNHTRLCCPH